MSDPQHRPPYGQTQYQQPPTDAFGEPRHSDDISQKKLVAGLLGIFLGGLGLHKFYLGLNGAGIIMLGLTVFASVAGFILSFIFIGFLLFPIVGIVSTIGFIEGIIYLVKSDEDFRREYVIGRKDWF